MTLDLISIKFTSRFVMDTKEFHKYEDMTAIKAQCSS